MPPRKSNVSQASGAGDEGTPAKEKSDGINIEDLALPRTMVQRLAKGVLPPNTQIQKDAITAFSKSATVFVNYLSNAANDRALLANRKTISPANVLEALGDVELEIFLPRVEAELRKFNEIQTGKRNEYRRKLKEGKEGKEGADGKVGKKDRESGASKLVEEEEEEDDEGQERAAKRVRRDSGDAIEAGPHDQLVERPRARERNKSVNGTDETMDEEDTMEAAEDDGDDEGEEGGDGTEDDEDEEDDEEDEDEDEEDEEEEERDEVADMDSRLQKLQAGMNSSGSSRAPSPTSNYSQEGDDSD
ncbi:MAG: hypothetical protein Q9191_003089 [Dirinaria sp. TL-2023a]